MKACYVDGHSSFFFLQVQWTGLCVLVAEPRDICLYQPLFFYIYLFLICILYKS